MTKHHAWIDWKLSTDRPAVLDLRARWLDIEKIARPLPSFRKCLEAGWQDEDLVQEVYVRALARQSMPSRYDPVRSGVCKYLTVLCNGILLNLLQTAKRPTAQEIPTAPRDMDAWSDDVEHVDLPGFDDLDSADSGMWARLLEAERARRERPATRRAR